MLQEFLRSQMEAEEEERESRREGEVKLKSWEEVKSQLAPVDLAKPNSTTVEEKDEEEEDKSEEADEERREAEEQEDKEDETEGVGSESRSSPGATTLRTSPWPKPPPTASPPPLERSR